MRTSKSSSPGIPESSAGSVLTTLDNGVRVVVFPLPHLATVNVSVFVRSGSQHESPHLNGISHVMEHMAFKGTRTRNCQQINLDAERLGAEVNAHTDKDHTAFHMRGHARDAETLVSMLGDIVQHGTYPKDELARERKVLLQEYAGDVDDPMTIAFRLFDEACYGEHATARPVIGSRANIRRFTRDDLLDFVASQYTGVNTVVGVAGNVDPDRIVAAARAAFDEMRPGEPNRITAPSYAGGMRSRRLPDEDQVHIVLGFPVPALADGHDAHRFAAAVFGEGMSSPFLDRVRERRGLVYHADCFTDVRDVYGQFVIEASTLPEHLEEFVDEVARLLRLQASVIDPVDFERARNQLTVRALIVHETPEERVERAASDLFALGRVRAQDELLMRISAVTPGEVRLAFAQMLDAGAAVGLAGRFARGVERLTLQRLRQP